MNSRDTHIEKVLLALDKVLHLEATDFSVFYDDVEAEIHTISQQPDQSDFWIGTTRLTNP